MRGENSDTTNLTARDAAISKRAMPCNLEWKGLGAGSEFTLIDLPALDQNLLSDIDLIIQGDDK